MALVDYLEIFQNKSSKYFAQEQGVVDSLAYILQSLCSRMLELQDPEKGAWKQVLDCPDKPDNYFEMSVTPMTAYVFLKGVRLGYLDEAYVKAAKLALDGIEKYFCYEDDYGNVNLRDVCAVAGLSDDRNGSYEYYIGEKRVENDPKGIGPWIMALTELSKLEHK
jgi:unsaturated rhamnogalacturonyl hydrolase